MRRFTLLGSVLVLTSLFYSLPVLAWHDKPSAQQLGLNNEIGAYLHKAVNGGPLFITILVVCHTQPNCPTSEQTAFILFYRTSEARDTDVSIEHPDFLGIGQFPVKSDGESLGLIIDFRFPNGLVWVRNPGTEA